MNGQNRLGLGRHLESADIHPLLHRVTWKGHSSDWHCSDGGISEFSWSVSGRPASDTAASFPTDCFLFCLCLRGHHLIDGFASHFIYEKGGGGGGI